MRTRRIPFLIVLSCLCATAAEAANTIPLGNHFPAGDANLPIGFEANIGQADAAVAFLAHGHNGNLLLTPGEVWLALPISAGTNTPSVLRLKTRRRESQSPAGRTRPAAGQGELSHRQRSRPVAHGRAHVCQGQISRRLSGSGFDLLRQPAKTGIRPGSSAGRESKRHHAAIFRRGKNQPRCRR